MRNTSYFRIIIVLVIFIQAKGGPGESVSFRPSQEYHISNEHSLDVVDSVLTSWEIMSSDSLVSQRKREFRSFVFWGKEYYQVFEYKIRSETGFLFKFNINLKYYKPIFGSIKRKVISLSFSYFPSDKYSREKFDRYINSFETNLREIRIIDIEPYK